MNYPYKIKIYRIRRCRECNKKLLVCKINFVKSKTCKWGYSTRCKECDRKYREKNKEKMKEYNEQYYEKNKEQIKEKNKQYREENKEYYQEYHKQYREENKEQMSEYMKEYYEEHKEEMSEHMKQYREEHKEQILKKNKQYYEENKEEILKKNKQYYEENKEQIAEHMKQYREEHKEEILKKKKQYREENPHISFNNHNKRRQLEENQGNGISKEQWLEMMNFFEWKCAYSGEKLSSKEVRTIDHIVALNNGGLNEIWNCVPMYRSYNTSKHTKDMEQWYRQQDFFSEDKLMKIYQWIEYAYNKWVKKRRKGNRNS